MIASVTGRVGHAWLDRLVVEVGGVGLLVHTTPAVAAALRVGERADLATTLVVREDSLTLFGFTEVGERDMFETLQTVSGVGPRIAMAMMSVLSPDEVRVAIGTEDLKTLQKVPGIGRKSAERLVLELRDKVGAVTGAESAGGAAMAPPGARGARDEVAEALVGLGYSARQADDAVTRASVDGDLDVSTLLRAALRELGR